MCGQSKTTTHDLWMCTLPVHCWLVIPPLVVRFVSVCHNGGAWFGASTPLYLVSFLYCLFSSCLYVIYTLLYYSPPDCTILRHRLCPSVLNTVLQTVRECTVCPSSFFCTLTCKWTRLSYCSTVVSRCLFHNGVHLLHSRFITLCVCTVLTRRRLDDE